MSLCGHSREKNVICVSNVIIIIGWEICVSSGNVPWQSHKAHSSVWAQPYLENDHSHQTRFVICCTCQHYVSWWTVNTQIHNTHSHTQTHTIMPNNLRRGAQIGNVHLCLKECSHGYDVYLNRGCVPACCLNELYE